MITPYNLYSDIVNNYLSILIIDDPIWKHLFCQRFDVYWYSAFISLAMPIYYTTFGSFETCLDKYIFVIVIRIVNLNIRIVGNELQKCLVKDNKLKTGKWILLDGVVIFVIRISCINGLNLVNYISQGNESQLALTGKSN